MLNNGMMSRKTREHFEDDTNKHYEVVLFKLEGCPACMKFIDPSNGPWFKVIKTANSFYLQKPNCPKIITFNEVDIYSDHAKNLLNTSGMKPNNKPTGVPYVAIFQKLDVNKKQTYKYLSSLDDNSYTFQGIWQWIDQVTQVEKCSGWLNEARNL
jgi:hypothetical protein